MYYLKQDPDLARRGFYMIGNLSSITYSNLDIKIPYAIAHALSNCMPVRICCVLMINPPYITQFILPIIKMLLSTKLSQRLNIITNIEILQNEHQIPFDCLPEVLGGGFTPEMHREFINQMIIQNISV